jgi:hypothetical protein
MTTTQNDKITTTTQFNILKGDIEVIKQHKNFGDASAFMNSENQIILIQTNFTGTPEEIENEDDEVLNVLHKHKFDFVMVIINDYPDDDCPDFYAHKIVDGITQELSYDEYEFYVDQWECYDGEINEVSLNELPANVEFNTQFVFDD